MPKRKNAELKLTRRPLKTVQADAGKPAGSPTYLGGSRSVGKNAGGTTRDVPTTHFTTIRSFG